MLGLKAIVTICFGVGLIRAETETKEYADEVQALFDDLKAYKSGVNVAHLKMNQFPSETPDRKYAIGIINLYTQASPFYSKLNSEMRNNYPNKTTDVWRRAGDLINRGIDILGPELHKLLYRGCSMLNSKPVAGDDFRFNQITSTYVSKSTAEACISCPDGILFQIANVYGLSIEKYSYFKFEREVLIKSYNVFRVTKGPVQKKNYKLYYLDGQPDVNRNLTFKSSEEKGDSTLEDQEKVSWDENEACKLSEANLSTILPVLLLILSLL